MTIATEFTTKRANMHLNGAGDRAKGATLFVELSNCVPLLPIQLVVSHCTLLVYDHWIIQPVNSLLAGCLFIQTVALEGGMCRLENIYNSLVFSSLLFISAIERAYFVTTLTILFNSVHNGF